MVDGSIVAAVRSDGDLLLRIDPAQREELLAQPGTRTATMGAGRVLGASGISVAATQLQADELQDWLAHGSRTGDRPGQP